MNVLFTFCTMDAKDSAIEFNTLDYLVRVQQTLSSSDRKRSINDRHNQRIAAYIRWHINNKLDQYEQDIAASQKPKQPESKLPETTDLCAHCNSVLTHYRTIPKKLKHKKRKKKGFNYETNLVNARCEFCRSCFKFSGLKKAAKTPAIVKKKKISTNNNFGSSQSRPSVNDKANNSSNSTLTTDQRKPSLSNLKTPTSSKAASQKEILQKLLSDSKKKRTLDNKTRLSDFLSSCFNK